MYAQNDRYATSGRSRMMFVINQLAQTKDPSLVKHISKVSRTPIEELAGKASVFVRGFCEYLVHHDELNETDIPTQVPLRQAQDAGLRAVEALGDTISVPYISQLTGKIEKTKAFRKEKFGKSYRLIIQDLDRVEQLMAVPGYGRTVDLQYSIDELAHRARMISHLDNNGGVSIHIERPVHKAAYQLLMDRFSKGELVMMFAEPPTSEDPLYPLYPEFVNTSVSVPNVSNDE